MSNRVGRVKTADLPDHGCDDTADGVHLVRPITDCTDETVGEHCTKCGREWFDEVERPNPEWSRGFDAGLEDAMREADKLAVRLGYHSAAEAWAKSGEERAHDLAMTTEVLHDLYRDVHAQRQLARSQDDKAKSAAHTIAIWAIAGWCERLRLPMPPNQPGETTDA